MFKIPKQEALASAAHIGTVIPVDQRIQYMHALEQASSSGDIGLSAALIARLTSEQRRTPLPRAG